MNKHMNKIIIIICCMLFTLNVVPYAAMTYDTSQTSSTETPKSGVGWLEIQDGIKILHIAGSPYEMGYQHGSLLHDEVNENIRGFLNTTGVTREYLLSIWNMMQKHIPTEYLEELHGLADGANISFEELAAANMMVIVGDMGGCFGFSAWRNATTDGTLLHARSFDYSFDIQDPLTKKYAHENAVLIVRNPTTGYASLIPSIAGSLNGGGGINEHGIAVGQQVCWSNDQTLEGTPGQFRVQQVLDTASTAQQAIEFLTTHREVGWNFIVSDSKIPAGYIVETTANHTYIGTDDSPTERQTPFWIITNVVRRTNFFINHTIADTQRERFNPNSLLSFLKLVQRTDVFYAIWRSYQACSQDIEQHWGSLDLNTTMTMFRSCYRGDTDILLKLIITLAEGTSFNRAWNMWVADPQSGEMVICFATQDKIAFHNPIHYFNFYTLLNSVPP